MNSLFTWTVEPDGASWAKRRSGPTGIHEDKKSFFKGIPPALLLTRQSARIDQKKILRPAETVIPDRRISAFRALDTESPVGPFASKKSRREYFPAGA